MPTNVRHVIFSFILLHLLTFLVNSIEKVSECGIRPVGKNFSIIGGHEAEPYSWPWATALYQKKNHRFNLICGSTLISNQYVLTAAHCVTGDVRNFAVKIGAHDLRNSGKLVEVESIIQHENYRKHFDDDIALLKLKTPLNFSDNQQISLVCLPNTNISEQQLIGTEGTMVGWGVHVEGSSVISNKLYEVKVPIFDRMKCQKIYEELDEIFKDSLEWDKVICAAKREGGKDTCQGDSGGPMMIRLDDNKYYQIGIVSFGYGCAKKNYPGVYTYVPKYVNWIRGHIK